jgi:transcription initiation factor TFIIIB Brf1 subunit/transcription initiation factor TFIIB
MKRLACIFGRHRWMTHVEHGEEYNVCARCGTVSEDELSKKETRLRAVQERKRPKHSGPPSGGAMS